MESGEKGEGGIRRLGLLEFAKGKKDAAYRPRVRTKNHQKTKEKKKGM